MRKILTGIAIAGLSLTFSLSAQATTTITDATGDFLSGFVGPNSGDLDVTSFSVDYNSAASTFLLSASLAGNIDPAIAGFYVIGANTGTGLIRPFGNGFGHDNVIFNQAIVVQKTGMGSVGGTALDPSAISISGKTFSVAVPLSLLPSTGFAPEDYGFNLWPRVGTGNNNQISDFAPDNANISAAAVPEPATWALLLIGFGAVGFAIRRRETLAVGYA
jgi:hypothetical protein